VNNTAPCDDDDVCTTIDVCSAGDCVGGGPTLDCDDGQVCTTDLCDSTLGCTTVPNTLPCTDGNPCTSGDTCSGGVCVGGPPPTCDDHDVCTTDSCSAPGGCSHAFNSAPCDDGSTCTLTDVCSAGTCVGGDPRPCDDDDVCTTEICDPLTGCGHVDNTAPCDDGDLCTVEDVCAGGACTPGAPVVGTALDQCHETGTCDSGTGICSTPAKPDGETCDDGNSCTVDDACQGGVCVATGSTCGNGTVDGGCGEQCDDGNTASGDGCSSTCQTEPFIGCPLTPLAGCLSPTATAKSQLKIKNTGVPSKSQLQWKWGSGAETTFAQFGSPMATDDYALCIYDNGTRIYRGAVPPGGDCSGKPCWKSNPKGYQFKSKTLQPDGIQQLKLKAGAAGKAQIQIKAKGALLQVPDIGALSGPLVVQVRRAGDPICWQAVFHTPFTKNDGVIFNDKSD
jgi:cysteine-rich repeat protein